MNRLFAQATDMPRSHERSLTEILTDIIGNIKNIFRSELELAITEIREDAVEASRPAATLAVGLVLAAFSLGLMLLAMMYGLATVLPIWSAALIVCVLAGISAVLLIRRGRRGLSQVSLRPETTIASLKENMRWATKPNE